MHAGAISASEYQEAEARRNSYAATLQAQIEEKKQRKEREKQKKLAQDLKDEEDLRNYNPYGRGGGGAPVRDADGKVVTNIKVYVKIVWHTCMSKVGF